MFPPTIQFEGNVVFDPPSYKEPVHKAPSRMISSLYDVRELVCTTLQLTNAPEGITEDLQFISDMFENYRDDQETRYNQKIFEIKQCYKVNPIFDITNNRVCDLIKFFKSQSQRFRPGSYEIAQKILHRSLAQLQASYEGQNCDFFGYNSRSFNLFD